MNQIKDTRILCSLFLCPNPTTPAGLWHALHPRVFPMADPHAQATHPGLQAHGGQAGALERFTYDDAIVRKFLLAMMVWALVAFLVGLIIALLPVAPQAAQWQVGSSRPLAWLAVVFETSSPCTSRTTSSPIASALRTWALDHHLPA